MFSSEGYTAIKTGAARVRRADRAVVAVSGADAASWLQGLLTNDVLSLAPGERRYAAYLTPQGRMITDMWVTAVDGRMLLDVPAPLAASLALQLDGLIFAEDTQVKDESAHLTVWGAYGPATMAWSDGARSDGALAPSSHDDSFGVPGRVFYLDHSAPLPPALASLPETDLDTLDVVRIEAGTPRFLVDMDEDTIPLEAGIEDRAISFTKGCYVGQEIIVRVTTRGGGRVAKKLVRLMVQDPGLRTQGSGPRSQDPGLTGSQIFVGDRAIGRVTSAAFSPSAGHLIALGYVHRDFAEPGTDVTVSWHDARVKAVVG